MTSTSTSAPPVPPRAPLRPPTKKIPSTTPLTPRKPATSWNPLQTPRTPLTAPSRTPRPHENPSRSVRLVHHLAPLTPEERERCTKNGLCFRCRQPGHMIQKCPGPSRPSTPSTRPASPTPTTPSPQPSNRFAVLPVDPIPDAPSEPSPPTEPPQSSPPLTPPVPFVVIPKSTNCRKHSLYIPVSVIISPTTLNTVTTTAIVDSGAQINCINWAFITRHRIPTIPLKNPFPIRNTDQTSNIYCRYEVITYVKIGSLTQRVRLYAINGGKENIILGHPWLEQTNPSIDWNKGTVKIGRASCRERVFALV